MDRLRDDANVIAVILCGSLACDSVNRLVDQGHTVLVIEHHLDVIKSADYILDLGPDGGNEGGYLVASGTPEQVAQVKSSYTGQYLKELL